MEDRNSDILKWPFRRFHEFVRGGDWRDLPVLIQWAMIGLWRAEQDVERSRKSRPNKLS